MVFIIFIPFCLEYLRAKGKLYSNSSLAAVKSGSGLPQALLSSDVLKRDINQSRRMPGLTARLQLRNFQDYIY